MEKIIVAFAQWLGTPLGFLLSNLLWVMGTILVILSPASATIVTYILSVEAILISSAVLIAGDRDTKAIQVKLDKLIEVSEATNDVIGIENEDSEKIERVKEELESR